MTSPFLSKDLATRGRSGKMEVAIRIILDERDFPPGKHRHQPLFVFQGHKAPEGIIKIGDRKTRRNLFAFDRFFERVEVETIARLCRYFQCLEAESLDGLQNAEVSRRLHRRYRQDWLRRGAKLRASMPPQVVTNFISRRVTPQSNPLRAISRRGGERRREHVVPMLACAPMLRLITARVQFSFFTGRSSAAG